jgi:peptide/nickel transport system substrate-binding protein
MRGIRSVMRAVSFVALVAFSVADAGSRQQHAVAAATGATLIYGSTMEPDTLQPWFTGGNTLDITIFDALLSVDRQGRLQPDLATSYSHTPDGLTWTFHLRHGVKWADGKPFTSADVAYNYRTIVDKKNGVPVIAGWDLIDQVATPDAYTFICHLKTVSAPFLVNVGLTLIIPRHIFDRPGVDLVKAPFNRAAFGTGPFMVSEWKAGDHVTLVANPYSWRGRSYFQKIVLKIVPDRDTLLVQLRTGEVDAGGVLPRQLAAARALPGKRVAQWLNNSYKSVDFTQYGFLREKVVRQALDYATPRQAIFKGILQGLGAIATSNESPLLSQYYNPNVPTHPFNLAKAAALLRADGFVKGADGVLEKGGQPFDLTLWVDNDSDGQRINQVLQQEWNTLGIKVTLRTADDGFLYGPTGPYFAKAMSAITANSGNNPDPDDSLYWISAGIPKSPTDTTCCNTRSYFYPLAFQSQIDALYRTGNSTIDLTKRRVIYFKIQAMLADQVPSLFLYWVPSQAVIPANLQGFSGNGFAGWPLWNVATWRET